MSIQTISILAVIVSPIIPIVITLWYHSYKEKRDGKRNLFYTLMAHRKSSPPAYEWVNALNLIDVVFADNPKVLQLWHEYYDLLHTQPPNFALWEHKYIDMLSEVAQVLGYKKLKQTDIEKFYSPVAHGDQLQMNTLLQGELLRVLKNTASLVVTSLNDKTPEGSDGCGAKKKVETEEFKNA